MAEISGVVTGITEIATTVAPVAVESVAKVAPAATEAIAQTAVQGVGEVGKAAIETGAETLSESAVKAAEAQASVLSEGLAQSAESAMAAGGADAALSSISDVQLPGELSSPSDNLDTAVAQNETGAVDTDVNSLPSENKMSPSGTDIAVGQGAESSITPDKKIADSSISPESTSTEPLEGDNLSAEETNTQLVRSDGSQQEDSSGKQDNANDKTSAESESTEKMKVLIPDQVWTKEEYQEELKSIREEAKDKGEEISEEDIQQRAFERYIKKLLNREDERAREANRVRELEKKMKEMEDKMKEIIEQNEKMMEMLKAQADIIKQLSEWANGHETDEEKKKNLLRLVGEIAAITVVGVVAEGGKTTVPKL